MTGPVDPRLAALSAQAVAIGDEVAALCSTAGKMGFCEGLEYAAEFVDNIAAHLVELGHEEYAVSTFTGVRDGLRLMALNVEAGDTP